MVDMMAIQGLISGLQTATDITKSLYQLKASADIQAKVSELQSAILSAQSSTITANSDQFTLIQRVRDLEEEIASVKAWEEEKERYQLIEPMPGCFVYALKETCKCSEPPHWICEHCYQDGRKSVLHDSWDGGIPIIKCFHCSFRRTIGTGSRDRKYV